MNFEFFGSVVGLLVEVGKFINHAKATELQEKVLDLRRQWDAEIAKGDNVDDALLYSIERELWNICDVYRTELARSTTTS